VTRRRWIIVGVTAVLVLVVGYGAWAGVRAWWSWRNIERVEFDLGAARDALAAVTTTTAPAAATDEPSVAEPEPAVPADEDYDTVLAIGNDLDPNDPDRQVGVYADAILFYLDPAGGGNPILVSLPRDLLVTNPCTGELDKLSGTLAGCGDEVTGAELVALAVQEYTGIAVDHFAVFGFEAFTGVIDAVGGVTLCSEYALRGFGVDLLPAGCAEVDGATALRWVRSRNTQEFVDGEWRYVEGVSDLTRNARQQQLLLALLAELKGLRTPGAVAELAGEVSDAVQLDETLSMGEAIGLAWDLRRVSASSIRRPTIPVEATATEDGSFALISLVPFLEVIGAG
jgi:LCP family protein required for cell wall assembly